jgi:hypothetical protein
MRRYTIPLFVSSIGSALDFYPVPFLFNVRRPHAGFTDAQLLASDWNRVGQALYSSMNSAIREAANEPKSKEGSTFGR